MTARTALSAVRPLSSSTHDRVTELRLGGLQTGTTYTITVEAFTADGIVVHAVGEGTPA